MRFTNPALSVKAQIKLAFMLVQQMIAPLNQLMIGDIWINTEIGVTLTRALAHTVILPDQTLKKWGLSNFAF